MDFMKDTRGIPVTIYETINATISKCIECVEECLIDGVEDPSYEHLYNSGLMKAAGRLRDVLDARRKQGPPQHVREGKH
jgi:hypothetical protein